MPGLSPGESGHSTTAKVNSWAAFFGGQCELILPLLIFLDMGNGNAARMADERREAEDKAAHMLAHKAVRAKYRAYILRARCMHFRLMARPRCALAKLLMLSNQNALTLRPVYNRIFPWLAHNELGLNHLSLLLKIKQDFRLIFDQSQIDLKKSSP